MKITKILGENGLQSQLCNSGACPAIILADNSNAYIQGYTLDSIENSTLKAPHGEEFVRIPLNTLKNIASQIIET